MNKRGLSHVITTVLFVLLAIAAVVIIWLFLRQSVTRSAEQVELEQKCFLISTEPSKCLWKDFFDTDGDRTGEFIIKGIVSQTSGEPAPLFVSFKLQDRSVANFYLPSRELLERYKITPSPLVESRPKEMTVASIVSLENNPARNLTCTSNLKTVSCIKDPSLGDLCDEFTSFEDIEAIIMAFFFDEQYTETYSCPIENADFNCDGIVDFFDTDGFIDTLFNWCLCNQDVVCGQDESKPNFGTPCDITNNDPDNDASYCNNNCGNPTLCGAPVQNPE